MGCATQPKVAKPSAAPYRLIVIDDHALVREGLHRLVAANDRFEVVADAATNAEAMRTVDQFRPDVVILDLILDHGSGFDLIKWIVAHSPHTRILVVSMCDELVYAARAMRAGAHGYVEKREASNVIIQALDRVVRGKNYVSMEIAGQLVSRSRSSSNMMVADLSETLSDRELQVMERLGQYQSVSEIAEELSLSPKTVSTYRDRLRTKLGIDNSKKLTQFAAQWFERELR